MKKRSATEDTDPRILDRLRYHMGVLKAAGVVDVAYQRDGRQVTSYRLGATGEELFSELFVNPLGRSSSRRASVLQRVAARQH